MDPDRALGSSLCPDATSALVAAQVTHISTVPVAAWPLGTNMIPGDWAEPGLRGAVTLGRYL